jgi:hypothetical protein
VTRVPVSFSTRLPFLAVAVVRFVFIISGWAIVSGDGVALEVDSGVDSNSVCRARFLTSEVVRDELSVKRGACDCKWWSNTD